MKTIDSLREPLDDLRRRDRDCDRRSDTERRTHVDVEPAVDPERKGHNADECVRNGEDTGLPEGADATMADEPSRVAESALFGRSSRLSFGRPRGADVETFGGARLAHGFDLFGSCRPGSPGSAELLGLAVIVRSGSFTLLLPHL